MRASVTESTAEVGSCRTSTGGVGGERPRQRHPLALPAGQVATALGQRRPRALGEHPQTSSAAAAPSAGPTAAGDGAAAATLSASVPSNRSASCAETSTAARPATGSRVDTRRRRATTTPGFRVRLAGKAAHQGGRVGRIGRDDAEQLAGPQVEVETAQAVQCDAAQPQLTRDRRGRRAVAGADRVRGGRAPAATRAALAGACATSAATQPKMFSGPSRNSASPTAETSPPMLIRPSAASWPPTSATAAMKSPLTARSCRPARPPPGPSAAWPRASRR